MNVQPSLRDSVLSGGVLVVRHGLTQWNTDQRWQGWADIPLSEIGRQQARFAAKSLAVLLTGHGPIRIVSSDLDRAHATAVTFAEALGVANVRREESLRERHVGDLSGLTSHEINQRWPGLLDRWRSGDTVPLPGGEDEEGFRARIFEALTSEARRSSESGGTTVLVSHGGAIRTLEAILEIDARHVANVGGRWFYWDGDNVIPGDPVDLLDDPPSSAQSLKTLSRSRADRSTNQPQTSL